MSSFISNVLEVTEKQKSFVANSQEVNAQSLANYMFGGRLNVAKNVADSKMRAMLSSFALEIIRSESTIKTIANQYYPFSTVDLLARWEKALKIPDDCFKVENVTVSQRQKQVVAKLGMDGLINRDDFIALALFFGQSISIKTGFEQPSTFPAILPMILSGSDKTQKFTMVVTFIDRPPKQGFPYTFPITFPPNDSIQFLECLITKLSPANVRVIFKNGS